MSPALPAVAARPRKLSLDPTDARAARVAALDALARREHASSELEAKLLGKGFETGMVAAVLERLRAENLLDDNRFIDHYVSSHARRGQGPVKVRACLREIDMDGAVAEEFIAAYPDWVADAQALKKKKFGAAAPSNYADKARQAKFLAGRGYTGAQIRLALGTDIDLDDL
jgi:regulatory protein